MHFPHCFTEIIKAITSYCFRLYCCMQRERPVQKLTTGKWKMLQFCVCKHWLGYLLHFIQARPCLSSSSEVTGSLRALQWYSSSARERWQQLKTWLKISHLIRRQVEGGNYSPYIVLVRPHPEHSVWVGEHWEEKDWHTGVGPEDGHQDAGAVGGWGQMEGAGFVWSEKEEAERDGGSISVQTPSGRWRRSWGRILLRGTHEVARNNRLEWHRGKFLLESKEKKCSQWEGLCPWTRCPERPCNLRPWRYSKPNRIRHQPLGQTQPWGQPCSANGDVFQRFLKPQLFSD